MTTIRWAIMILVVCAFGSAAADEAQEREAIRAEIEQLRDSGMLSLGGVDIASGGLLAEVYEQRNFAPTWTDQSALASLLSSIKATASEGLDPGDYHVTEVEYVQQELARGRQLTLQELAAADIMLTDSVIRLGYHLNFGKVNPEDLDSNWNFRRDLGGRSPAAVVQAAINSKTPGDFMAGLLKRGPFYRQLTQALAKYRAIADAGGWPEVPPGPTLKPGMADPRLAVLAQRLTISGDLPGAAASVPAEYDETLELGVKSFQARHGLEQDGVIGPASLAAMNVTALQRVEQIRVNLERARWVLDELDENFILVNIAGFTAYLVNNRLPVWSTKVQVGKTYHQTPVFRDEMQYVVFNPTWTVPYSIATKELLPKIKRDPAYFETRDFDIKNRDGQLVDPDSVDWSQLSRGNFPYTLIQRPGPKNALGRMKFIFPNEHSVYLHDTPSKALFGKAERAFSHGCMRVENPIELAQLLLADKGWDKEKIQASLDGEKTETVYLSEKLPVLVLYWTSEVDEQGAVKFYNDPYDRDGAIKQALNAPFQIDLPDV